jgi:hypothetical protein
MSERETERRRLEEIARRAVSFRDKRQPTPLRNDQSIEQIDADRAEAKKQKILQRIGRNLIHAVKRCQ